VEFIDMASNNTEEILQSKEASESRDPVVTTTAEDSHPLSQMENSAGTSGQHIPSNQAANQAARLSAVTDAQNMPKPEKPPAADTKGQHISLHPIEKQVARRSPVLKAIAATL
jgi:LAS superfamily LD-carboxypeptidase LdcB